MVNIIEKLLYVRFVLDKNGSKTPTLQIGSPPILLPFPPVYFLTMDRIPVDMKNQNINTNVFPTVAEKTDKIKTPIMSIIGQ